MGFRGTAGHRRRRNPEPQAAQRGEIPASRDWSLVADVMLAMGLLRVISGETVDADFIRQVIEALILPAVREPTIE